MNFLPLESPAQLIDFILNAEESLNLEQSSVKAFVLNAAIVIDSIWHFQNQVVHQAISLDVRELVASIRRRYVEHSSAWMGLEWCAGRYWHHLPIGWLKVNTDVAIRQFKLYIAISMRDSSNSLCMTYSEGLVAMDPLVGEPCALVEALKLAKGHQSLQKNRAITTVANRNYRPKKRCYMPF